MTASDEMERVYSYEPGAQHGAYPDRACMKNTLHTVYTRV